MNETSDFTMNEAKLISICIPAYNRPAELSRLLNSIDADVDSVEIVIAEDCSPKREEIRHEVEKFMQSTRYEIRYFENEKNLGFDGNLRNLVDRAAGTYIMFMGDDDLFVPSALDEFIAFLQKHTDKKYILRSYLVRHESGQIEYFRYLPATTEFLPDSETVAWLFKRSVTICGFTIDREEARKYSTSDLDGTLLYQVYLMAQVCLRHPSIYCDIPVVEMVQTFRKDTPMFGNSEAEKSRYTPGSVSEDNSINFSKAYFEVTQYLDARHGTDLTRRVREDLSKYSYPFLSIQRKRGIKAFLHYAGRLENELGFGCTKYFFLYKWALVLLGEKWCDKTITFIKNIVGHTPKL